MRRPQWVLATILILLGTGGLCYALTILPLRQTDFTQTDRLSLDDSDDSPDSVRVVIQLAATPPTIRTVPCARAYIPFAPPSHPDLHERIFDQYPSSPRAPPELS